MKKTLKWSISLLIGLSSCFLWLSNVYAGGVLSAGVDHVCGIKDDSTLICWGDNSQNQATPPEGTFKEVSAGFYFNCALNTEGSIECWGRDTAGEISPPPGQFIQIETGGNHACALAANGAPICWGANGSSQVSYPPGPFQQLALGDAHSCGLKADGTVECWGNGNQGQANIVTETFSSIVAGYQTTCGIKTDGVAICWGKTEQSYGYLTQIDFGVLAPTGGHEYDLGSPILCGLKADQTLSCPSLDAVPSGVFSYVTVGGINICYRYCDWNKSDQSWRFDSFACGIRENGLVACWGVNHNGRATPPVGITMMQPTGFTPPHIDGFTRADIEQAREEAKQACQVDPVSCGIQLTPEAEREQLLETARQTAIENCQANPASCGIEINTEIAAVIGTDLALHVSKMEYQTLTGTSILWADLIFGGQNEQGELFWILDQYGEVE